jgi:hypothetical protein
MFDVRIRGLNYMCKYITNLVNRKKKKVVVFNINHREFPIKIYYKVNNFILKLFKRNIVS